MTEDLELQTENKPVEDSELRREARGGAFWSWVLRLPPELPIFLFYAAIAFFLTWPLITGFNTSIYGVRADNQGILWLWWWYRKAGTFGATASFSPLIGFPFGTVINTISMEPLALLVERFLLLFLNEVIVYNLSILTSFFVAGVTMYFLARYLTGSRQVGFYGGAAYMASTYLAYHAMFFDHLAMIGWMPLYLLLLFKFMKRPSGKSAAWLAVGGILVAGSSVHYGFFMGIFTGAFLTGMFAHRLWVRRRALKKAVDTPDAPEPGLFKVNRRTLALSLAVILAIAVVIMPVFAISVKESSPSGQWPTAPAPGQYRGLEQSFWGSAFPREYVFPSSENPTLGWITRKVLDGSVRPFANSLFLGWSALILAAVGLVLAGRRRRKRAPPEGSAETGEEGVPDAPEKARTVRPVRHTLDAEKTRHFVWGFLVAGLTCMIFSFPPYMHIGTVKIPLPSMILRFVVPWLRWYMRLAIAVFLAVVALACFGLKELEDRVHGVSRYLLAGSLVLIVILELIIVPPFKNFNVSEVPEAYRKIASMPEGTAFSFYPLFEPGFFNTSTLDMYQRTFKKPMLNGAYDNSDGEALRRVVYNPYNPETPGILSRFGLNRLVFLGKMFADYEGYDTKENLLGRLEGSPGLALEERFPGDDLFGDAYIFEVTAPPADIVPIYQGDFTVPHLDPGLITVRLMVREGILNLVNYSGHEMKVSVKLPVTNLVVPHDLVVTDGRNELQRLHLENSEQKVIELDDLTVPAEGLQLHLLVSGQEVALRDAEITIFGPDRATISTGDASIIPVGG